MKKTLCVLLVFLSMASCSRYATRRSPAYGWSDDNSSLFSGNADERKKPGTDRQRMVIYNAHLKITVKNPDTVNSRLTAVAAKYEGYVQTLGNQKSVIRVKAERLTEAITEIAKLGKVKSKTISGDDLTDQYLDYQIRMENAEKARKRYLELLQKAENVEAALKVEKELERLNGEIDRLQGHLNRISHLSQHSTITVYMEEKVKPGILGYVGLGLYHSVRWLFVRN